MGKKLLKFLSVLLCAALLSSCSGGMRMDFDADGNYFIAETGASYKRAPSCYEPEVSDRLYAELEINGIKTDYYEVEGADPSRLLADEFSTLFYSTGYELPSLENMGVSLVSLYNESASLSSISDIRDADKISEIIEIYNEGEAAPYYSGLKSSLALVVRFFSPEHPGFCYTLTYVEYKEDIIDTAESGESINYGRKFLYNRSAGRCVMAGDIFSEYIELFKS